MTESAKLKTCPVCGGRGYIPDWDDCSDCYGCKGEGRITPKRDKELADEVAAIDAAIDAQRAREGWQ